jgi:hypothetical protein
VSMYDCAGREHRAVQSALYFVALLKSASSAQMLSGYGVNRIIGSSKTDQETSRT